MIEVAPLTDSLVLGRLPKEVSGGRDTDIILPDNQRYAGVPNVGFVTSIGEAAAKATGLKEGDVVFYDAFMARQLKPMGTAAPLCDVVHYEDVVARLDNHGFSMEELVEKSALVHA